MECVKEVILIPIAGCSAYLGQTIPQGIPPVGMWKSKCDD